MNIQVKCVKQVLPNVWHHNVLIDDVKYRVIESSDKPMTAEEVISGIRAEILVTTPGWVVECD